MKKTSTILRELTPYKNDGIPLNILDFESVGTVHKQDQHHPRDVPEEVNHTAEKVRPQVPRDKQPQLELPFPRLLRSKQLTVISPPGTKAAGTKPHLAPANETSFTVRFWPQNAPKSSITATHKSVEQLRPAG